MRYQCLVLDHDDTVVNSTASVNYPAFVQTLRTLRPDVHMTLDDFFSYSFEPGFGALCSDILHFSDSEMDFQYRTWLERARTHVPDTFPGMCELLQRYHAAGGHICVVSHSVPETILRDYRAHGLPVSENLLEQDFYASGPNQKWAGDITYLRTDEGWLYLAVVIDLWSRAVIGWSMSPRMTAQLACDALQMALWRRKRPRNVIVHTDRGGQYCSADYQAQLKRHNLRGSMSAKGCCYDNACVESFFHSLKVECIHGEHFISREIMRATVFNYIECDYNRWRRHSWCGGLSPEQFENKNLA